MIFDWFISMKKLCIFVLIFLIILMAGCTHSSESYDIIATTLPVFDFTTTLCEGTGLTVGQLVTENVSCLHDYTLQVKQMQMIESADVIVLSGAGLEDFLDDALSDANCIIDSSIGVHLHSGEDHHHHHDDHNHENDPHIWLSPANAAIMAKNICTSLSDIYPEHKEVFVKNLDNLLSDLKELQNYGQQQLAALNSRNLITFHDGFGYLAESFDLTILEAIEEESGSEASAEEIIHLIELLNTHSLPAIFIETNGSTACAGIIAAETGVNIFTLDMAMASSSYFDAMYHNIDMIKEALQ